MHRRAPTGLAVPEPGRVSRRDLLRGALLGSIALVLAACGLGTKTPSPSSASRSPATPSSGPTGGATAAPTTGSSTPTPGPTPTPTSPPAVGLHEMIAGLLVVGFRGRRLADAPWVRDALATGGLGGVILFDRDQLTGAARNVRSPAQVSRLTSELRAAAGRELVIGVDQEGGIVTRLGPAHGFPPVASQASVGQGTKAEARTWARDLAATLATSGFTLNFAPVVDLDVNPSSPAIGALDRSFSADPDVVVEMATIEIRAHHRAGVRTTLKHFPGIGSSTTNTDFGVADVTDSWHRVELEPFRRLIAAGLADVVMAGHVVNRRLDPDHPASLSKAVVTDLLRGELGWDGIVVTDDLQAAAITDTFGADEAVLLALEAGNDLLLFANQQVYEPDVVQRVVGVVANAVASGRLTRSQIEASWARVQRLFGGTTA